MCKGGKYLYDVLTTRESYTAIAEGYVSWRNRPWSIALLSLPGTILDLGSGPCVNGVEAALRKNSYVVCLDYSPTMINVAKRVVERRRVPGDQVVADMTRLPFRENSFNTILAIASIHHVPPDNLDALARQLHGALKPRGLLIATNWSWRQPRFTLPTLLNISRTFFGLLGYPHRYTVKWRTRKGTYMRIYYLYSLQELIQHLQRAGFRIISKGYYSPAKTISQNTYVVAINSQHL